MVKEWEKRYILRLNNIRKYHVTPNCLSEKGGFRKASFDMIFRNDLFDNKTLKFYDFLPWNSLSFHLSSYDVFSLKLSKPLLLVPGFSIIFPLNQNKWDLIINKKLYVSNDYFRGKREIIPKNWLLGTPLLISDQENPYS